MPTYEYRCKDCGRHVEVVQSFTDDPLTTCSVCGGSLRKVFSPIGISFKGSGFYRTDSRAAGDGTKKKTKETADTAPGSSGSSGSSSAEKSTSSEPSSSTSTPPKPKSETTSETKSA
ncbi:MAG: FmdB family zinc ribbon protein [Acidimicrobiales bacterium]